MLNRRPSKKTITNKKAESRKHLLVPLYILLGIVGISAGILYGVKNLGAAPLYWTQTSWIGGTSSSVITSDVNTYLSATNLDASITAGWFNGAWQYRKKITINESQISGTDPLADFTVLISTTHADWKDTSNGGKVGQSDGGDILFTSSNGTTKLGHEIEKYVNTTGELVVWVKIPSLSATVNTDIYMYYGNTSSVDQWDTGSTWASSFKGVWHMHNDPTATAPQLKDSTTLGYSGTSGGAMTSDDLTAGVIGNSIDFDGNDYFTGIGSTSSHNYVETTAVFTMSAWVKLNDYTNATAQTFIGNEAATLGRGFTFNYNAAADNYRLFVLRGTSGTQVFDAYTPTNSGANNNWNHVVFVSDGVNVSAYINGVAYPNLAVVGTKSTGNSSRGLEIGRMTYTTGTSFYTAGKLDEIRLNNTALSSDWIATEYTNQSSPSAFITLGVEENSSIVTDSSFVLTVKSGTGNDGSVTINSSVNLNADNLISGRTCTDGGDAVNYSVTALTANTATLSTTPAAGCLSVGDEVLLINLQGTSTSTTNVGNYETLTIQSVNTDTVTFTINKAKYYGDGASNDTNLGTATTNQRVMLQRVPNYTNFITEPGGSIVVTASTWDGVKGGVLYFKADFVSIGSGTTISMAGKGYRGGAATVAATKDGEPGESYAGQLDISQTDAYFGGGGGGGRYVGAGNGGDGGGGGGYGIAGSQGTIAGASIIGGAGGSTYGVNSLSKIFLGSGGGEGGRWSGGLLSGSIGGNGGGIVMINATKLTSSGIIAVSGNDGASPANSSGGGGGGSGGSILIKTGNSNIGTSSVVASGGYGSGTGANGGAGRIALAAIRGIGTSTPTYHSIEPDYVTSAVLTSQIFDSNTLSNWGVVSYNSTGTGTVTVKVRTGNQSNLSDALDWNNCVGIVNNADATTGNCAQDAKRYAQYQITLIGDGSSSPTFQDISIEHIVSDTDAPTTNATSVALSNAINGGWTNIEPTITWVDGVDNVGGTGILGYCISLDEASIGTSTLLNPVTNAGKLNGIDDGVNLNTCPYIATGSSINLNNINSLNLISGKQYYFSIKAIDLMGNVWNGSSNLYQDLVSFKYDNTAPNNPSYFSAPGTFLSTKDVTITWPTATGSATDAHSGLVGLQYKIGDGGTWYGDLHNGNQDSTDTLVNDGAYTTDPTYDYPNLSDGINVVYFRALDNAGNISPNLSVAIKINTSAPSQIQNLSVNPSNNTVNEYSFDWDIPSTFIGEESKLSYCYTVNTLPTNVTCNYTAAGVTNLATDAFATQPGDNTMYVVAKDEAGNINYATHASITFTYSGSAPGIPVNLDVADISNKDTSDWKLAVTWGVPTDTGAGISSYKVYRSETEATCSSSFGSFSLISTVSGTSFIDTSLDQKDYYYCVKACDSANNCSAVSGTATKFPTGKYTTPANLTSEPALNSKTGRKAVISWTTDRRSDSRIQYGTESGVYLDQEVGNSTQLTAHTVTLTNLEPGKTYYYKAKWTDEDGNTGMSAEKSFTTDSPPTISDVNLSGVTIDGGLVKFSVTGAYRVKVYYGSTPSFGTVKEINTSTQTSSYTSILNQLNDGTKYYYKINPIDLDGFEYEGTVLDFTTLPRPRILNVQIEEVKNTAQPTINISWESNTNITSIVTFYPKSDKNSALNEVDIELKTAHKASLVGLLPSTRYELIVKGVDSVGNEATSTAYEFTTATDTRPPLISNIKVDGIITNTDSDNNAQLIVSWNSDELATSQVQFGEGSTGTYTQSTQVDTQQSNKHVVVISGLRPSTIYHLRLISRDSAGNEAVSNNIVTITPKKSDNALELVLSGLSDIFKFLRAK